MTDLLLRWWSVCKKLGMCQEGYYQHVPFLRWGGSIITGNKRYSGDLPQSGLELPYLLTFEGSDGELLPKMEKLIGTAFATVAESLSVSSRGQEPDSTRYKIDSPVCDLEKGILELSDLHINLAQDILKKQFPNLNGLQCTLYQTKKQQGRNVEHNNQLQIIHCHSRNHWIATSTVGCNQGVYDSVYIKKQMK